jgi:hypothetical protein
MQTMLIFIAEQYLDCQYFIHCGLFPEKRDLSDCIPSLTGILIFGRIGMFCRPNVQRLPTKPSLERITSVGSTMPYTAEELSQLSELINAIKELKETKEIKQRT